MHTLALLVLLAAFVGQDDPGAIAVVSGDPGNVTFALPAGTPYQIDFDINRSALWFDRARTLSAAPQETYAAKGKGDFDGTGVLDGGDVGGFVNSIAVGGYDPLADFNDDETVDFLDVPYFVDALVNNAPAEGVVLYVEAFDPSIALGDAPVYLLTDPDQDSEFTVGDIRPVTQVHFIVTPQPPDMLGGFVQVLMSPALSPLAFDERTSAVWDGKVPTTIGPGVPLTIAFTAAQVHEQSASEAKLIVGEGTVSGDFNDDFLRYSTGSVTGRLTFYFEGRPVSTPPFEYAFKLDLEWRLNELQFDPHDPGGYEPEYGPALDEIRVLHVVNPADAGLDTFWYYQAALEVPVYNEPDALAASPQTAYVDMVSFDAQGQRVDTLGSVPLVRIAPPDSSLFFYRMELSRPFLFVDAAVDKRAFPGLWILQVTDGGFVVMVRR